MITLRTLHGKLLLSVLVIATAYIPLTAALLRPVEKQALIDFATALGYNSTWSTPRVVNLKWDTSTDPCENGQYWSSIMGQDPFFYCDSTNTTLLKIYMNNINMTGVIPDSFGLAMSNLTVLNIGYNRHLQGRLPATFANMTNLQELYFDLSELVGPVPTTWSALTQLRKWYFQQNMITSIPPEVLKGMTSLTNLWFYQNPTFSIDVGTVAPLTSLVDLQGYNCQVTGNLSSIASLSGLKNILLQSNNLTGTIPSAYFSRTGLTFTVNNNSLDLSSLQRSQVCTTAALSSCNVQSQGSSCMPNGGSTSTTCTKCRVNFCPVVYTTFTTYTTTSTISLGPSSSVIVPANSTAAVNSSATQTMAAPASSSAVGSTATQTYAANSTAVGGSAATQTYAAPASSTATSTWDAVTNSTVGVTNSSANGSTATSTWGVVTTLSTSGSTATPTWGVVTNSTVGLTNSTAGASSATPSITSSSANATDAGTTATSSSAIITSSASSSNSSSSASSTLTGSSTQSTMAISDTTSSTSTIASSSDSSSAANTATSSSDSASATNSAASSSTLSSVITTETSSSSGAAATSTATNSILISMSSTSSVSGPAATQGVSGQEASAGSKFPIGAIVGAAAGGLFAASVLAYFLIAGARKRRANKQIMPLESGMLSTTIYASNSAANVTPMARGGLWATLIHPFTKSAKWTSQKHIAESDPTLGIPTAEERPFTAFAPETEQARNKKKVSHPSLTAVNEGDGLVPLPTALEAPFDPVRDGVTKQKWNKGMKLAPLGAPPSLLTTTDGDTLIPELSSSDLLVRRDSRKGGPMGKSFMSLAQAPTNEVSDAAATETSKPLKNVARLQDVKARVDTKLETGGQWATRRTGPPGSTKKQV